MSTEADSVAIQQALQRMLAMGLWSHDRLYAVVPDVSAWSPAQHLAHLCETTRMILGTLETLEAGTDATARATAPGPNLAGRAVLVTGRIPRGRAQAPPGTVPPPVPARAALAECVRHVARRTGEAAGRAHGFRGVPGARPHPRLGPLGAWHWWRFLRIHLEHHLAIVADIDRHRVVTAPLSDPEAPLTETS